jgi:hypothetical protein
MPNRYVFVNLPGFYMQVWDTDTLNMESKVIVGGPQTRSPVLTSKITNFVTLPQWTVPISIIMKEMLPKIQKDTNYLAKENLMVVDKNDSVLYPSTINWKKLDKDHFLIYLSKDRATTIHWASLNLISTTSIAYTCTIRMPGLCLDAITGHLAMAVFAYKIGCIFSLPHSQ